MKCLNNEMSTVIHDEMLNEMFQCTYNQGQKSLDRLSLFSSIHPFTALKLSFFVDCEMES